ncbi:MAG: DUF485 domain-containing protein [Solirubrobacteraceae bacterium]
MTDAPGSAPAQAKDIDWEEIERSPAFQELVRKRKSYVLPGTIFYLTWYMGFILLTAYAEDFMSESVYGGLTVGYCLALTQFLMVLVFGVLYLRKSADVFDPLAEKAIEDYADHHQRYANQDHGAGDGDGDAAGSPAAGADQGVSR